MSTALRFGTDGWRAVIADEFTFANLERMAQATATALLEEGGAAKVVVGHDRRFLASAHADRVAEILAGNGLEVIRATSPAPTPAISGLVVDHGAGAGIVLTASHNPAHFGGFKIKSAAGGSALPEFTDAVEAALDRRPPLRLPKDEARAQGLWQETEFQLGYFRRLSGRVDVETLRAAAPLTVVVDSMHGCGGDLIASFLAGTPHRVITLRSGCDPLFGGHGPEPVPERLQELRQAVLAEGADLGLATDGDADRLAAVDETGAFLSPLPIILLLADHLLEQRGERGALARTCANTILLDRMAAAHGLPLHVFPIGFKHLVPLLAAGELLLGGEESGGIGIRGYLPERDGILMGLLLLELRVAGGRPLQQRLRSIWQRYGEMHYRRRDVEMASQAARAVAARLARHPPEQLGGVQITGIDTLDGTKLLLGDVGWIMVRSSGTEPVLRIYCEARSIAEVDTLLDALTAQTA